MLTLPGPAGCVSAINALTGVSVYGEPSSTLTYLSSHFMYTERGVYIATGVGSHAL